MQKATSSIARAYHGRFTRAITTPIQHPSFLQLRTISRFPHYHGKDSSQALDEYEVATSLKPKTTMATDDAYMDFLNKANQDADEAHASAAARSKNSQAEFKTLDGGQSEVPQVLKDVCKDSFYVSDADEPFHAVSLKWTGDNGLPDEEEFATLIQHWDAKNAEISILDPLDWDSQGQNTKIIEAVREAGKGNDVRVYRVARDGTRVEYWVITRAEDRVVGVKALGIES